MKKKSILLMALAIASALQAQDVSQEIWQDVVVPNLSLGAIP